MPFLREWESLRFGVQAPGFRVPGSGFRVLSFGCGFQVQDSGFRVQSSGFRVLGFGFGLKVQDAGFRVVGSGFRILGLGLECKVQDPGSRVQGSGSRVQGSGFRVQSWSVSRDRIRSVSPGTSPWRPTSSGHTLSRPKTWVGCNCQLSRTVDLCAAEVWSHALPWRAHDSGTRRISGQSGFQHLMNPRISQEPSS